MSTFPPLDSHPTPGARPVPPFVPGSDEPPPSPELIEQTRSQIRALVHEITQLAQSDIDWTGFAEGFMSRVGTALAAVGGALWLLEESGTLRLQYQFNLAKARLSETVVAEQRHQQLLRKVVESRQAVLVPPQSGISTSGSGAAVAGASCPGSSEVVSGAGNPSDYLLVLGPFLVEGKVEGIVEIVQRPDGGPATQRGYLRFLMQMCDLAGDYLKNRRLRDYQEQHLFWRKLDRFVQSAHRPLDPTATAFTVANDGRSLIECDRLSVLQLHGRRASKIKARLLSVSGLDALDRRASEVQRLEQLVELVARTGQPFWHCRGSNEHPPQIETRLQAYLDQSHVKALAIIPLHAADHQVTDPASPVTLPSVPPKSALVMEQLADDAIRETTRHRLQAVAAHAAIAMLNAQEHGSILFLRIWKLLGRLTRSLAVRHWPGTALAVAVIGTIIGSLICVQAPCEIAVQGKLLPLERQELFALVDGTVIELAVRHQSRVRAGDLLVKMRNESLDGEILALLERETTTHEQIESKQMTLVSAKSLSSVDESLLSGELAQLKEIAKSIEQQLELLREKRRQLEIRSPIDGQVLTWDAESTLLQRPVQRGQTLLSLANPDGDWELELYVPERRVATLLAAAQHGESVPVRFALKSRPGEEFHGRVIDIERLATVRGESGNSIAVRVAIDKHPLPETPSESTVIAQLQCGQRALGYVWFGDVVERIAAFRFRWLP
ncbi:MAG: HlyD family efflux transporter periplasmic adaptor subunit [Planctomycetes bacterium]|nr:HlyD family efflux transporter periplasmic adaptor subunit [Planctomycetota bacterium]